MAKHSEPSEAHPVDRGNLLDKVTTIVPFRATYWVYGLGYSADDTYPDVIKAAKKKREGEYRA